MSTTTTPAAAALEIAFRAMPKPRTWDADAVGMPRCPVAMRMSGAELRSVAGLPAKPARTPRPKAAKAPKAPVETGIGAKGGAHAVLRAAARRLQTDAYKAGNPIPKEAAHAMCGTSVPGQPEPTLNLDYLMDAIGDLEEAGEVIAPSVKALIPRI